MARYSGYPCVIGGTTFNQIAHVDVNPDITLTELTAAGTVYRTFMGNSHSTPRFSIGTQDLTTWLALNTAAYVSAGLAAAAASTNLIQYQLRADCSTFDGGSNHYALAATKGCLYPERLSVRQDDENGAMLESMFLPISEAAGGGTPAAGLNPPVVPADGQALTGTPAHGSVFYLGPVKFNTTRLTGLVGVDIHFGLAVTVGRFDGNVFITEASITLVRPVITLSFGRPTAAEQVGSSLFGAAASGAGVTMFFRKGVLGGTRVADATTQHIKIVGATGMLTPDQVSWRTTEDGTSQLSFRPTGALTATVGVAIA